MLCYRDQAWCHTDCVNTECFRNLTPEHRAKAIELDLPVCYANFWFGCKSYVAPPAEWEQSA